MAETGGMKVGWLADDPGYVGGAELTQAEFRSAAPKEVEVISCPAGHVTPHLDRYVVHNCMSYGTSDMHLLGPMGLVTRYHNDVSRAPLDVVLDDAQHIFCSPPQRERMGMEGECVPPAIDLNRFKTARLNGHREGNVCIGRMAYGKGLEFLAEYEEPVDVYSSTPIPSQGNAIYMGEAKDVAKTLGQYETFVFLPVAFEPFGRAVVEAWAAGCHLVVNKNVGALDWIRKNPKGLETAAERFWGVVLS